LILGTSLAPAPHRAQTVRRENDGHHANLTHEKSRCVSSVCAEKMDGLSVTRE
jgi:hypothetical protein